MSQNETATKYLRGAMIVLGATFIALSYNNCGQHGFYAERAYVPSEQLVRALKTQYAGQVSPSICVDSAQYECTRKIFSQDVENSEQAVDFACALIGGHELCVGGKQFSYNSTAAIAECVRTGCTESFEYEEFHCYVKLPNAAGAYPVEATSDHLESALAAAHALCEEVVAP